MRLTIPHYFDFGAEGVSVGRQFVGPAAWDAVRASDGPFGMPETRAEWELRAAEPEAAARARGIAEIARDHDVTRLCSYGVGTGGVELQLARAAPELQIGCTDYAPRAVARLRKLFTEATVVQHDLLLDLPLPADLHVLHRVDTEFSNLDLARILTRFHQPVLLVPSQLLDWRLLAREMLLRLRHSRAARAGWLRTEAAFRALWRDRSVRDVRVGDLRAFLLT